MSRTTKALAAAVPALATLATIGLGAGPAGAGAQYEPLIGDITGDGIADRVTLGGTPDDGCTATVERGKRNGGYRRPVVHEFATDAPGECPDMGVVLDLGGDGHLELVLTWFWGSAVEGLDLLVLRDFVEVARYDTVQQPQYIGTAHLDTDGLLDLYEYTDQGEGFRSYLNTPSGALVEGPLRSCEETGDQDYQLHDLDGNGAQDIVFNFYDWCYAPDPDADGVVVVFDDGTVVPLVAGQGSGSGWDIEVLDLDGDGDLDLRTTDRSGSGIVYTHVNNGDRSFTSAK